jgi:hypothetical protein
MRFTRVVLALVFGLAMAGPETHACPVHSAPAPAGADAAHAQHQDNGGDQQSAHCTCPQTCGAAAVGFSLPAASLSWTGASSPVVIADFDASRAVVLPARARLLPFALAPPPTTA